MGSSHDNRPFQAIVQAPGDDAAPLTDLPTETDRNAEWSLAALEDAYQRALESADAVAAQVEQVAPPLSDEAAQIVVDRLQPPALPAQTPVESATAASQIGPEQVLEALLFVGGDPLTGRRLADLLGGGSMHAQVEDYIVQLNARYDNQCRPYHIQLGEGGYRLSLRPEFEVVRNRVYGLGPKDVRLSQDALEVLALVAYQQPISRETVEATGKANVATLIRQLLRLELISLERGTAGKDDITYRTTSRFLQLFALDRLEDLPHPEDLMFK